MINEFNNVLKEKALSPNAFFLLYDKYFNTLCCPSYIETELLHKLQEDKYIKIVDVDSLDYRLRQKAVDLVKEIDKQFQLVKVDIKEKPGSNLIDKKSVAKEINEWIEDYRNLFKGLKPGSKGDKGACLNKMIRFFDEYSEFADKNIIMNATKKYIQNEAHQNYRFLQRADYFIFKLVGKEETSRLASFCDEVGDVEEKSMTELL